MRSPLTGVVFALELTHDVNMLLPLLLAVTIAHGFTVLVLRRSILTEKVSRRGYHLSRGVRGRSARDHLRARGRADRRRRAPGRGARPSAIARSIARAPVIAAASSGCFRWSTLARRLVGVVTRAGAAATGSDASRPPRAASLAESIDTVAGRRVPDEPLRLGRVPHGRDRGSRGCRSSSGRRHLVGMIALTRSADRAHAHSRSRAAPRAGVRRASRGLPAVFGGKIWYASDA